MRDQLRHREKQRSKKKKLQCDQRHWDYYDQYGMKKYLDETEKDFAKFKKSAQKEVNYLVKEFECKKSASAYARATQVALVFLIQLSYILTSTMKIYSKKFQ